jgi:hypothetical protein
VVARSRLSRQDRGERFVDEAGHQRSGDQMRNVTSTSREPRRRAVTGTSPGLRTAAQPSVGGAAVTV